MLFLFSVLVVCCVVMLIAGIIEQRRHFANLAEIPTRVLVNGIRGKSSITRLVAGALRGGDLVTVAKTTGTAARFIHPDATEEPVYRKFGIANVVEQIGIVRRAAAYKPDALVMECMAVMPPLQELNQAKLIQSTIGVLCNVREDHVAEMGPTLDDIGRSLSRSMPHGGICVTAEKDRFHVLQEEADARNCRLIYADPEIVSDEELRGFSWFTFKENVAIALVVADLLGIDRETALQGMYDAPPDPGVLSVERYVGPGDKRLRFANVFAANDPESTLMNINQLLDLGAINRPLNVVINCRPDRVERNGQMGQIVPDLKPDKVFVIGHPSKSAIDAIPADWRGRAVDLGGDGRDGEEFMNELFDHLGADSSLVAIGNIHGQGEILLEHLAELPSFEEDGDALPTPGAPTQHVRHDQTMTLYVKHLDPYANLPAAEEARRMRNPHIPQPRGEGQQHPNPQFPHYPNQQFPQQFPQPRPYAPAYEQFPPAEQQQYQAAQQQQHQQQQRPELTSAAWPQLQQPQPLALHPQPLQQQPQLPPPPRQHQNPQHQNPQHQNPQPENPQHPQHPRPPQWSNPGEPR
ncbi:poly-gamma-glutamate synthase PgsB [Streptomyces sp. NPDC006487]|uniref:poly-gamma-glutamate synthase PgsB n=1 Tax=Streptomyces sp. NPDC006487 TaxID=3364748 RepID=UPI003686A6DD